MIDIHEEDEGTWFGEICRAQVRAAHGLGGGVATLERYIFKFATLLESK